MRDPIVLLEDIVKDYQTDAGPVRVLDHVSLHVGAAEFIAVVGPSGSGKTTLANVITGIDRPTSGRVNVLGATLGRLGENAVARWRGRNVGVVFQFFQLLPTLTVLENVMLPMDFCCTYSPRRRATRAGELLAQVGLENQARKLPSALSAGQQQRAAIARALANDPPLLVADEPTGNLDSKTATAVFSLFSGLVQAGKTIIMISHDRDLVARVPRAVVVRDGRILEDSGVATIDAPTTGAGKSPGSDGEAP